LTLDSCLRLFDDLGFSLEVFFAGELLFRLVPVLVDLKGRLLQISDTRVFSILASPITGDIISAIDNSSFEDVGNSTGGLEHCDCYYYEKQKKILIVIEIVHPHLKS
jgi:hypothetical protein